MSAGEQGQAVPVSGAATPRLADVLDKHTPSGYEGAEDGVTCFGCDQRFGSFREHAQHQAAVWREACMIRTREQLDALPVGAVILSRWDETQVREVIRRELSGGPNSDARWYTTGYEPDISPDTIDLPALLLWHPGWEGQP